jgi:hypothetical protein
MSNIQYTQERTADNGEVIKARLTETAQGYLIEILANGMAIIDETFEVARDEKSARSMAHIAATAYVFKLNNPNYGVTPEATDILAATETMINELIEAETVQPEPARITNLRQRIASLEWELEDVKRQLRDELEQMAGEG